MLLFVLVLSLSGEKLYANTTELDSLKNKLLQHIHDSTKADIHYQIGVKLIKESIADALKHFYTSRQLSEELEDTVRIVNNILGISDALFELGEYEQLKNLLNNALELSKEYPSLLAKCHNDIAIIHFQLGEYEKSLKHDKLALKYYRMLNNILQIAYSIHNVGTYYYANGKLDSALINYQLSNKYLKCCKRDELLAFNCNRIAYVYSMKRDYYNAVEFHKKALQYYAEDNQKKEMSLEENYIASAYFNWRDSANAFLHANKAVENAKGIKDYELHYINYILLSDLYIQFGKDYKNALKYTTISKAYSDSLEIENRESIVNSIKTHHKYLEQKDLLKSAEQRNKILAKQRTNLIIFMGTSLFLLMISVVVLLQKRSKHKKNIQIVKDLDKANVSMRKLLSIIGHDLRDSIANLKNFTQLMQYELLDNKSIETMVTKFVPMVDSTHGLLDTLLTWSRNNDEHFEPKKEKYNAKQIVKQTINHISHLAKTKKIDIIEKVEDVFVWADINMLSTVLRNLISNAIKFSEIGSKVTIEATVLGSEIQFSVMDEGIGMTEDQIDNILRSNDVELSQGTRGEKGSGVGLTLCSSFLSKHNAKLSVKSKLGVGSIFKFYVPIDNN